MNLLQIVKTVEKFTVDHSPMLLTGVAVAGVVSTAVLTAKASFRAVEVIQENDLDLEEEITFQKKVKLVWPLFIPPLGVAAVTVTSIVCAHRIGARRAAAVAAAFSVSEQAFTEYREKVIEKFGPNKERAARDEIAQERMDRNPLGESRLIITGNGVVPCYDTFSGRYFESDMESLKKAENDINYKIIHHDYASVNDYYDKLGIPHIALGEEVGWTTNEKLEVFYSTTMTDDQRPAISIEFHTKPMRGYFRVY